MELTAYDELLQIGVMMGVMTLQTINANTVEVSDSSLGEGQNIDAFLASFAPVEELQVA